MITEAGGARTHEAIAAVTVTVSTPRASKYGEIIAVKCTVAQISTTDNNAAYTNVCKRDDVLSIPKVPIRSAYRESAKSPFKRSLKFDRVFG